MLKIRVVTLCLCLAINHAASAQLVERTNAGALRFTDKIVGKWEVAKVNTAGRSTTTGYGPSNFTTNTWTIQTSNGDRVYELSAIRDDSDPLEVTFVDVERKNFSFEAFIRMEGDRLTIVRGIGFEPKIQLPKNMDEGPRTIVYSFKKAANGTVPNDDDRQPLNVRLVNPSNDSKVLVDVTVKPFYGGKIEYSTEKLARRLATDYSPRTGTVITGKVEQVYGGKWNVSLVIEIGAVKPSDDPETTIVRSEKLQVSTNITPGKTFSIPCGEDRTCELTFK